MRKAHNTNDALIIIIIIAITTTTTPNQMSPGENPTDGYSLVRARTRAPSGMRVARRAVMET